MYEELVRDLREWPHICADYHGSIDELHDKAADAIEELSKPRWISVEERLPEPFDRVIVYDKRWGVLSAMKGEDDSWGGRNDIVIEKVTHWMPLPEPPKEETE